MQTLGEKLKYYRKKGNISQFELELKIGISFGSLSRFEHNLITPTKETLTKLSNALNLTPSELADLLGIKIYSAVELISAINKLSDSLNLESVLQTSVDILFDLYPGYNGGVIFVKVKDTLHCSTVSNIPNIGKALKLIPIPFYKLKINLKSEINNLCVKAIQEEKPKQSYEFADFSRGTFSDLIAKGASNILNFQSGIVIPMKFKSTIIGCVLYTKRIKEIYNNDEIQLLSQLTTQFANAIYYANKADLTRLEIYALNQKGDENHISL